MLYLHLNGLDEFEWVRRLQPRLGDYPVRTRADAADLSKVEYILAWKPHADAFAGMDHLKAVLSYGAGVDALLLHPDLPHGVPIVRFVDPDLTGRMRDYVVAEVLAHHRLDTLFRVAQKARRWKQVVPLRASDLSVGVMGLGVLGSDALAALGPFGYRRLGWSRSPRSLPEVETFSGAEGLDAFLAQTDILVCLLPLTADTRGVLNLETFRKLRRGALPGGPVVINAARGGHQVTSDVITALQGGTLGAASLDVFETEPLPEDSPLWGLENCRITPHVAAVSNPDVGAAYFARIIGEHRAGGGLPNLIDTARGY